MSEIENILDVTQEESTAFEAFKEKYMKMNPIPVRPTMKGLGWQFWITVPCALSAIVLAALRTANIFYKAAKLSELGEFFSIIEAFVAMIAIEGGLVAYAAILSDRKSQEKDKKAIHRHNTRLIWAILLMVVVSMIAGLGQSATVVKNMGQDVATFIQYSLFIIMGIGASLIAWIGGEVLGSQIALANNKNLKRMDNWNEKMETYMKSLRSSWSRSQERKLVRGELSGKFAKFGNSELLRTSEEKVKAKDEIIFCIEQIMTVEGRKPTQKEVIDVTGRAKGYVNEVYRDYFGNN